MLGGWQTGSKHLASILSAAYPNALKSLPGQACWGQWKDDEGGRRWLSEKWVAALDDPKTTLAAALFRISITPIDTVKTLLQVQGPSGMAVLSERVAKHGVLTMYEGALGSSFATLMGHYPWFITYNWLQKLVPPQAEGAAKLLRSALIGFCCSFVSDCVSNLSLIHI